MTRRGFAVTIPILTAAILALAVSSCENPVGAVPGVTAVSTNPLEMGVAAHTHRCTIPASDIADLPAQATYFTTTAEGHSHQVKLRQADLQTLADHNGAVSVTSEPAQVETPTEHTHRFVFQN